MLEVNGEQNACRTTYVLDTSFLVDLSAKMRWAFSVGNMIRSTNSEVVIPSKVEFEYNNHLNQVKTDDFGVPIVENELEELLQMEHIFSQIM